MRESEWSSDVCSSDLFPSHDKQWPVYQFMYGVKLDSVDKSTGDSTGTSSDTGSESGWANILDPAWWWHLLWPTDDQWAELKELFVNSKAFQILLTVVNFFTNLKTYIETNSGAFSGKWRLQPTFLYSLEPGDKSIQTVDVDLTLLDPLVAFARTLATCTLIIATAFRIRALVASLIGQNTMMSDYNEINYGTEAGWKMTDPDDYLRGAERGEEFEFRMIRRGLRKVSEEDF